MVNRPKYDDFVQVGSTTKRFHDTDVSFVQFSCPHTLISAVFHSF